MSRIFVHGTGAVSPAGWGVDALYDAVTTGAAAPVTSLGRPGHSRSCSVLRVPVPMERPAFLQHPRLRRTSPITHFALSAAIEAIGSDATAIRSGELKLGVVFCAFTGSVNYSSRFYSEVLHSPGCASPMFFTETVFNAPASHLATYFGTQAVTYTTVGDQGEFLKALAIAGDWLMAGRVQACLVVASEEADWLTADALRILDPGVPISEGAGAVYLRSGASGVELVAVTEPELYLQVRGKAQAARRMESALGWTECPDDLLCDSFRVEARDAALMGAWPNWRGKRMSPRRWLGEGLAAGGAWQTVVAVESIRRGLARRAVVPIIGSNEQAVAAAFSSSR